MKNKKKNKGFTLIELVIVIAIIAILISIAAMKYSSTNLAAEAAAHNANVKVLKSAGILYRIDIHLEVPEVNYKDISSERSGESSEAIRNRVKYVRELQKDRYRNESFKYNSEIPENKLKMYCSLDKNSENILELAFKKYGMSARTYNKILKIARTIADMDGCENIKEDHVLESIQYRTMDKKFWGN
ncbi:magnesium chelatase subunit ChlI family protein [Peptoniphilus genitalis]